jgi:hypothetical protein
VQHAHHHQQRAPEVHHLDEAAFLQLDAGDEADDERGHHAQRQLAVELLDAVGEHQARVRAVADARGHARLGRHERGGVDGAGVVHRTQEWPLRQF